MNEWVYYFATKFFNPLRTSHALIMTQRFEFKIPRWRRPRKRRLKNEFALVQSLSKCKRTLFEPNS